jgi:putative ABC transport system ATP-binding protein
MAAYARRMVHFVDGKIAKDAVNPNPVTAAPPDLAGAEASQLATT